MIFHLNDKRVADSDAQKYCSTYYNSIDILNSANFQKFLRKSVIS